MATQQPALFDGDAGKPQQLDRQALREMLTELIPDMLHDALSCHMENLFVSLTNELPTGDQWQHLVQTPRPQAIRHNPPRRRPIQPTLRPCRKR